MKRYSIQINRFKFYVLPLIISGIFATGFVVWTIVSYLGGNLSAYLYIGFLSVPTLVALAVFSMKRNLRWLVDDVQEDAENLIVKKGSVSCAIPFFNIEHISYARGNPHIVTLRTNSDTPIGREIQFIPLRKNNDSSKKDPDVMALIARISSVRSDSPTV